MTFWEFMSNICTRFIDRFSERAFFGLLIVGAFVVAMGTLANYQIPGDNTGKNAELFGQGLVALIGAIGIIVGAIWKNSPTERADRETINTLVNKQPPVTGKALDSVRETNDERSNGSPAEGAACPRCGAYRPVDSNFGGISANIPDNIPGL